MSAEYRRGAGTAAALGLFVALSLVFTYPLPLHVADAVEDRQDALLNVWIVAWGGHQLLADPTHLFDANIFYPYPRTLAFSELLLGNALLALPISAAGANPVLGYNVALLLSFALSGLGTYLLTVKLTRRPAAGLVAGLAFAFCSYRMSNLAQAQLLTTQWLPFTLLALHGMLQRPTWRRGALFVLFFWLQTVSSFYYGLLLALVAAGVWASSFGMSLLAGAAGRARARAMARSGPLAAACLFLLVAPLAWPYFRVQRELGFERSLADSEPFSASLRQYALVPPGSVLHGLWLPSDGQPRAGGYPVDALFPGLTAVALAAAGVAWGRGRRRWVYVGLLLAAFILSLGPRLYLAPGRPAELSLPLPYAWLYAVVPGFKALRAPVRFDALVALALAVLAGYGTAVVGRGGARAAGQKRPAARAGLAILLAGLVTLESLVWPGARAEPVPVGAQVPAVYRWLDEQPPGPILELPMAFTEGGPQLDYQYLSTYHWRATPDGYSGFVPPRHGQIVYEMERFPSERSIAVLQALGVEYAVVHSDRYPADRRAEVEAELPYAPDLSPVNIFGSDRVYRVGPGPGPDGSLRITAYLPARAAAGQPYSLYLVVFNGASRSRAFLPTQQLAASLTWQAAGRPAATATVSADLPLVIGPQHFAEVIAVPAVAPEAPGRYSLVVAGAGGADEPLGAWRATAEVQVGEQRDDSHPVAASLIEWEFPDTVRAGQALPVRLAWRAMGKIDAYYSVYVKLLDGQGNAVAGWDGQPQDGRAPTLLWRPQERIADEIAVDVPAATPAGEYTLEVGMYRAEDLARCLLLDGTALVDRVVLGRVRVEP